MYGSKSWHEVLSLYLDDLREDIPEQKYLALYNVAKKILDTWVWSVSPAPEHFATTVSWADADAKNDKLHVVSLVASWMRNVSKSMYATHGDG